MPPEIPYDHWTPLTVPAVVTLFDRAPFQWCLAGGYAVEQFVGAPFREHGDIDVVIFRDEQISAQDWLTGWELFAADPPGTLRKWLPAEYLPFGIHDIWGYQTGSQAWQLQLMIIEVDGQTWFNRRNPHIRGNRHDLITTYNGLPCLRIEVQLLYKANGLRPKDELDFQTCLPLLSAEARQWLKDSLSIMYPQGHVWQQQL
jgi:hypothetical protein